MELEVPMGPALSKAVESPELLDEYPCGNNGKKIQICHVPPGNPDNRHTLCIARAAVQSHIEHGHLMYGDFLGSCDSEGGGGDTGGGGESGGEDGGSGGSDDPAPCDFCHL